MSPSLRAPPHPEGLFQPPGRILHRQNYDGGRVGQVARVVLMDVDAPDLRLRVVVRHYSFDQVVVDHVEVARIPVVVVPVVLQGFTLGQVDSWTGEFRLYALRACNHARRACSDARFFTPGDQVDPWSQIDWKYVLGGASRLQISCPVAS